MKKLSCLVFTVFFSGALFAQDANNIIDKSRNRINAETISTQTRMVITGKNGSTTERIINQYSKDGTNGSRIIVEFLRPESVRGTRFLTMENKNGADNRWIYLPELNKVRRIASQEGSGSFMGTDLSYDDISSADRDVNKDTHKFIKREMLNGNNCYVIESIPKDSSYQYSKIVSFIDEKNYVNYKLELYDKKDKLYKVFETIELKDVQDRLSPWVSKMTNVAAGTNTTLYIQKLQYDGNIPEGVFTTNYIETGKY